MPVALHRLRAPRPRRAPVAVPTAGASAAQQGQNHQQNHEQDRKRGRKQGLKHQKEDLKKAGLNEKELKSEFVNNESFKKEEAEDQKKDRKKDHPKQEGLAGQTAAAPKSGAKTRGQQARKGERGLLEERTAAAKHREQNTHNHNSDREEAQELTTELDESQLRVRYQALKELLEGKSKKATELVKAAPKCGHE